MFYALTYARFNVFQAQCSAGEFRFTGSGVNCKLSTAFLSLGEPENNSSARLSEL